MIILDYKGAKIAKEALITYYTLSNLIWLPEFKLAIKPLPELVCKVCHKVAS